jgi:hypothetical protein
MKATFEKSAREKFKSGEFPGLFGIHIETKRDKISAGGPVTAEELVEINRFFCDFHERRRQRKAAE